MRIVWELDENKRILMGYQVMKREHHLNFHPRSNRMYRNHWTNQLEPMLIPCSKVVKIALFFMVLGWLECFQILHGM
jgi:hypothetical protein